MMQGTSAPILGALAMRARRRIAAHFLVHHAIGADDAVPYVPERALERRQFERLRARGVIREAGAGCYWLDRAAYQQDIERTRRMLVPVVIVIALIAAAVPLFFYRG